MTFSNGTVGIVIVVPIWAQPHQLAVAASSTMDLVLEIIILKAH